MKVSPWGQTDRRTVTTTTTTTTKHRQQTQQGLDNADLAGWLCEGQRKTWFVPGLDAVNIALSVDGVETDEVPDTEVIPRPAR